MKRSIHASLLILALAPAILAQNDERELYLVRSQNITNDLLKDAADLSSMQRAILWVKLAQRWWREDPKRSKTWIVNAIEVLEQIPNKETPEEHEVRLETARVLLTIVTTLDQKLGQRLLTILSDNKAEENNTADALIDAAVSLVEVDPKRAAELGALALRTGAPNNVDQLFFSLRARDPKVADGLFIQALAVARQGPRSKLSNSLMYVAFPVQRGSSPGTPVPPDSLRAELLQIYFTMITDSMTGDSNQPLTCGIVTWLSPVYGEFERLLPKQWLVVRQAMNQCQSVSPLAEQIIDDATRSQPLDTVESLLKAAADANDSQVRTVYKSRAANLAKKSNDYERALKILDDMAPEEREFMGESWDSFRWNWAADGAIEHYKRGRFREMNLLLDGVPSDLQPLAKASFVVWLPEESVSETAPIIQILKDALAGLKRVNTPGADKHNWYFSLLRPTVKYQPAEANAVLKDAIASLNQIKEERIQPLNQTDWLRYLGPPLLKMDEFVVKDALASITPVPHRAQLRLALLDATLKHVKPASRN